MFDEYFNPLTIAVFPILVVAAPRAVDIADSLVSTSIDQDAPSTRCVSFDPCELELANESEGNCQMGWTISHGGVGVRGKEGFWYGEGVREGRIDMNGPWTFDFDLFLDFDFDLWARKVPEL
nr:hypothetical protein [Tanacetum cinerariifolium]